MLLWLSMSTNGIGQANLPKRMTITLNTHTHSIYINGQTILQPFDLKQINQILGKPSRTETHTRKVRFERRGYRSIPPTSEMVDMTEYYYIYDQWGLMFVKSNSLVKAKPLKLIVFFHNPRIFTNTRAFKYHPQVAFTGTFTLNTQVLSPSQKAVPEGVNEQSQGFTQWGILWGATSIGTVIDRLYSAKASPHLMIYLDAGKTQRISYIKVISKSR
ncbi:hypothetical protein M23134_08042 [Microscilla marina ATCC 23134]|uniref:DUF7738 domain-containing protein n=2 Tax=Microscilla marina TaxID=1027 RepID=A1ZGV1_MICM2|nr:hypothetical protein M23134_08042 [Microscilla marina ATCC 23134]